MATTEDYERIAKLGAYFVTCVYVTGVVVVSLRLAQFGISGMGLLREQYIFAGAWAMLPVLAISVVVGTFCGFAIHMRFPGDAPVSAPVSNGGGPAKLNAPTRMWRELEKTMAKVKPVAMAAGRAAWTTAFWALLAAGVFQYALNRAVPGATSSITIGEVLMTGGKTAVFAAGIGVCGAFAVNIVRSTQDKWNYVLASAVGLTSAIVALAYLSFFAVSVYARIPSAIGGGADTRVRLVVAPEQARAMQLDVTGEGAATLRLLFVADDMYYVISPRDSTRAVGIPATAILGIETLH